MAAPPGRQQRLFTGALFPEGLNAQLFAFATRHGLQSNVWVPHRAFEVALRPYSVFILPKAALCDLSLTPGSSMAEVTETIGTDRVLVNAQHTSQQRFMENFRQFMMSRQVIPTGLLQRPGGAAAMHVVAPPPAPPRLGRHFYQQGWDHTYVAPNAPRSEVPLHGNRQRQYFSAADPPTLEPVEDGAGLRPPTCVYQPDPAWDILPPFQHPLAMNGSLILGTEISAQLLARQRAHDGCNNYWRAVHNHAPKEQHYTYTGTSEQPGRYNPFFCVRYVPHNSHGFTFPYATTMLMRHRAVEYGYVSRMWLTEQQGKELFGTHLLPERAGDFPTLYSTYHTGGLACLPYFCADQFDRSETLFSSRRELDLAAKGVWSTPTKIAAYPLLRQLQARYSTDTAHTSEVRTGADLASLDVSRHTAFTQLTADHSTIHLVGFRDALGESRFLHTAHLRKALQRQRLLCGYASSIFISHRTLVRLALQLRPGEEGVMVGRGPVQLPCPDAWTSGECWFNIDQMREPALGAELMWHWPRHYFTRQLLHGSTAVQCCRVQLAERLARSTPVSREEGDATPLLPLENEWVPLFVLTMARWKVLHGVSGVRYNPASSEANFKRYSVRGNILFRMCDVELDVAEMERLRLYRPVDARGYPYLRGLRQLLTLRAYERGYKSAVWVAVPQAVMEDHHHLDGLPVRQTPAPVRPGVEPLDATKYFFEQPPFVRHSGFYFVNEEELMTSHCRRQQRRDDGAAEDGAVEAPLSPLDQRAQDLVAEGRGVSAEFYLDHVNRQFEDGSEHAGGTFGSDEDTGSGEETKTEEGEEEEADEDGEEGGGEEDVLPYTGGF